MVFFNFSNALNSAADRSQFDWSILIKFIEHEDNIVIHISRLVLTD